MIKTPLRILLVEDRETDVVLTIRQIKKVVEKPEIEVVQDLEGVEHKLLNFIPDVVISDYNLPGCNGLDVLELTKSMEENLPFIFLTGTIDDEELAANTILAGANGYILKKHMNQLDAKLEPLFKQVVYNMVAHDDLRERIRKNKIAVNQIYSYLDNLNADNQEQLENIKKIRSNIARFNLEEDENAGKA